MQKRDTRRIGVLVFADDFGTQHPEVFAKAEDGPKLLAALHDDRAALAGLFDELDATFRTVAEATVERGAARNDVYRTARIVNRFASSVGQTGTEAKFELRPGKDRELEALAHTFVASATEMATRLQLRGMTADTPSKLSTQVEALSTAMAKQKTARETGIGIRAAIEARFKSARTTLLAMDPIVRHGAVQDPKLIAAWRAGVRIGPASRPKHEATTATPEAQKPKTA